MRDIGLSARELDLTGGVFRRYPDIQQVLLYGSRAKGTHSPQSDIESGPDRGQERPGGKGGGAGIGRIAAAFPFCRQGIRGHPECAFAGPYRTRKHPLYRRDEVGATAS